MKNVLKTRLILLILISLIVAGCTDSNDIVDEIDDPSIENIAQSEPVEYDSTLIREYIIAETEDLSIKALDKPLSQYSSVEILPTNIRKEYRILVPSDISKEELKATLIQVVIDKTSENKDIDLVAVFAYDRREDIGGPYTFGTIEWCPNGNWGGVTSNIASTNDRSSYKYVIDIKDKVGLEDTSVTPTELEFKMYDSFNEFFDAEWENIDLSDPYAIVDENLIFQKVARKYGITDEEAKEIITKVALYQMK